MIDNTSRSLDETTDRLRRAQKAGRLGTWDWDVITNELIWDGVEAVHGLEEGTFGGTFEGYLRDMHPEDQPRVLQAIGHARETGSDVDIEYRIILPDGSLRWVEGRGTCFRDEIGRTVRMAGTCQDITDRKLADQQKEDLFAFAAHELRSPLTSVLGYARLLEKHVAAKVAADDLLTEAVATIGEESRRMAEIIETFLDLARAEAHHLDVDIGSVDIGELLQDEAARIARKHPDAAINTTISDGTPTIESDAKRLRQVIANLLDNAVKYGGAPPVVDLTCVLNAGQVEIRVCDNGAGISEEDRQHLFGRFYRGSAWAGSTKGLGIGLHLSRQVAERLGGSLSLSSGPGEPTEFLLTLPVAQPAAG